MRILRRREVGIISERCHAVMEVDKELPACDFDEHYGYINTSTPYPRQRGTRKGQNDGVCGCYNTILFGKGGLL